MEEKNYKYQVLVNGSGRVIDVSNPDSSGARGWSYDSATKIITIFDPNDYTLTGNTSENKVVIEPTSPTNLPFNIILQQVHISLSEENSCAISIKGNIFCRLLVYEYNLFHSGSNAAGINVSYGSSIEIDELIPDRSGYIEINGGNNAACIGANSSESYGNITIKDVELWIGIGNGGAGIGYADYSSQGDSGEIKILGGHISMYNYGQYIMGGIYCRKVEISSGKLEMNFYENADGIFLKDNNYLENEINISGDAEVIIQAGRNSTGINCAGGKLIVNGGVVKAHGGINSCGIGSTEWNNFEVIINGGVVCAYGGERGAGIGTGSSWNHINYSSIEINGGIVSAYGKEGAAGIGGGVGVRMPNIKISSEASVIAQAYGDGAYDIGDGISYGNQENYFSGIFSSVCMYRGQMSGTYQGRLSGLFKGEVQRDYTKRVSCNLSGFYTGKATGRYSGIFLGRYVGYLEYSSLYTGLYSGLYSGLYEDIYSKKRSR